MVRLSSFPRTVTRRLYDKGGITRWLVIAIPGYCYCCGKYVPPGYGHFELQRGKPGSKWRIKCVKCASGRIVKDTDKEVVRIRKALKEEQDNGRR